MQNTYRKAITYFYKDGSGYRVESRWVGSNIAYSKTVDTKEIALSIEYAIKADPSRYLWKY